MTPKEIVQLVYPTARLDYSELMRNQGKPCWFIRLGWQGKWIHPGFLATPSLAWRAACGGFASQSARAGGAR